MNRVHPGTTHLLSYRTPVVTTSPKVQTAEQLVPFCNCDGVAFLCLPNPRQRPAHVFPNIAQRRRPGKAGCSWRPRLSGILSQESGEPGNAHRLWNFRPTWGSARAGAGRQSVVPGHSCGSSWVAASQNLVFKTCVLVPTSRLMTLFFFFFFFSAGQQRFLRFFTAFASLAPRGSANVC